MISDVLPGSPAESAGLKARDIITAVDGAPISALPYYTALMYLHDPAVPVAVTALRGQETLQFLVPALAADDQIFAEASIDPHESLISELGIFGKALNPVLARRNGLRSRMGIYVAATTAGNEDSAAGLAAGDAIASINGVPIVSLADLRAVVHQWTSAQPVVLQVERNGQYMYIERELEEAPPASAARH
jgi:S1-C subfamily serine protease